MFRLTNYSFYESQHHHLISIGFRPNCFLCSTSSPILLYCLHCLTHFIDSTQRNKKKENIFTKEPFSRWPFLFCENIKATSVNNLVILVLLIFKRLMNVLRQVNRLAESHELQCPVWHVTGQFVQFFLSLLTSFSFQVCSSYCVFFCNFDWISLDWLPRTMCWQLYVIWQRQNIYSCKSSPVERWQYVALNEIPIIVPAKYFHVAIKTEQKNHYWSNIWANEKENNNQQRQYIDFVCVLFFHFIFVRLEIVEHAFILS